MDEKLTRPSPAIGLEFADEDINLLGAVAARAEDRVFDEMLRPQPYGVNLGDGVNTFGGIDRFIIPGGSIERPFPFIQSSGSANGSVDVGPFRAVIGPATPVGTSPTAAFTGSVSGMYVPQNGTWRQTFALAPNSSGNPRIDAVVAYIYPDSPSANVGAIAKDPTTGAVTSTSVPVSRRALVTVSVVTGTPAVSPAMPTASDVAGPPAGYAIVLAYIYIPTGFTALTAVNPLWIREWAKVHRPGVPSLCGAAYDQALWTSASLARPDKFIPPGFQGFATKILRFGTATDQILDDNIDWRDRIFQISASYVDGTGFANPPRSPWPSATYSTRSTPLSQQRILGTDPTGTSVLSPTQRTVIAQSFFDDYIPWTGGYTAGSLLFSLDAGGGAPGSGAALYVERSTGRLRYYAFGRPFECLAIMHFSAQMANPL